MILKMGRLARTLRAATVVGLAIGATTFAIQFESTAYAAGAPFKGVANAACGDLGKMKASWWYNWYISPDGCKTGDFIPMVSGKEKHGAGDIAWQRDQAINAGYTTILGFNEPDHTDQANMSVSTAVALWPTLTANPSIRIGGPAPSSDSTGRDWLNAFMKEVQAKNLRVDFLTMHWYGWNAGSCDANATGLEDQIKWMESFPGNRPIWITEFGCQNKSNPDMATVNTFYQGALKVFARHPRVQRYAWYPWLPNNELTSNGNLTPLGQTFANASKARDVTLINRATGKCLDVYNASTADGGDVRQWTCTGRQNQRWLIEAQSDGTNELTNAGSGKTLDVAGCGTADGTNIQQWVWLNNACQKWSLVETDNGWIRLQNANSGKVADVADCNAADGTDVRLWTWLNNNCQQWQTRS